MLRFTARVARSRHSPPGFLWNSARSVQTALPLNRLLQFTLRRSLLRPAGLIPLQHRPGVAFLSSSSPAPPRVPTVTVAGLQKILQGSNPIIVDVREVAEFEETGLIPRALAIPRGQLEASAGGHIPRPNKQDIVVYCKAGVRSAFATDTLLKMGYTNVFSLEGGITAWLAAGGNVAKWTK